MSRIPRRRRYDRARVMQWLAERCPTADFPDLTDATPAGRAAIVEMLTKVCVRMRAHGLRGEWHYGCSQPEPTSIRTMTAALTVPLWTPWGKGFKGVALRAALGPPSPQRPALASYTTPRDANAAGRLAARVCRPHPRGRRAKAGGHRART
jgi:hypothetical protein